MEKKIEDFLHLYLGCMVELDNGGSKVYNRKLIAVGGVDDYPYCKLRMGKSVDGFVHAVLLQENRVKPILRPLSSMTEEDVAQWADVYINHTPYCVELDSKDEFGEFTMVYPDGSILSKSKDDGDIRPINGGELFKILLSKSFDLFGLIESGLAINQTSLPSNNIK